MPGRLHWCLVGSNPASVPGQRSIFLPLVIRPILGDAGGAPHPLTQWGKCRRDYRDFGKCGFESRQRPTGRGSLTVRLRKCLVSPCYPALFPGTPAALPHPLTQWGKCRQAYSHPSQRLARRTGTARGGLSSLVTPPFPSGALPARSASFLGSGTWRLRSHARWPTVPPEAVR